ncbi:hypothetical protein FRB94_005356 [Tulasnella sp. JGI-2019a]|nr:hypothetical protein FRB93_007092 [Tulasnella sp. JGI-2019a]KAG9000538.1 hypothetical protein FRB94_005356 [Tulasnella sp. JGI-2019a]
MLTESERAAIRRHHAHNLDAKKVDTARMYGVHPSVISRILQPQKHRKHRVTLTDKQKMEIRRLFHDNPDLKRKSSLTGLESPRAVLIKSFLARTGSTSREVT